MQRTSAGRIRNAWLTYWRWMSRVHRYEVEGFEHVANAPPSLIAGYHGRPMAHDLCMLSVLVFEQLGYLPHAFAHDAYFEMPGLRALSSDLGFVSRAPDAIASVIARREHLVTTPGGAREGYRSARTRYRVDWGHHRGYVKLAVRYGLPIIPVAASGVDDMFIGLNDGYRLGKSLGFPFGLPAWLAFGSTGVWPLTLPFPTKVHQVIGAPIVPAQLDLHRVEDEAGVERVHRVVETRVQQLLDQARAKARTGESWQKEQFKTVASTAS